MLSFILNFLVLLNPFALFIYLNPVMEELKPKDFFDVLTKASITSLIIFILFLFFGSEFFQHVLKIRFESFRIFGGIVISTFALIFIIQGKKSFFTLKGTLDDIAAEIALPFMVGAATVSLAIVIGDAFTDEKSVFIVFASLLLNQFIIMLLFWLKYKVFKKRLRAAFDKCMSMFLRLNGFLVGAIGVNMIISGVRSLCAG